MNLSSLSRTSLVSIAISLGFCLTPVFGSTPRRAEGGREASTDFAKPSLSEGHRALLRAQELESLGEYEEAIKQLSTAIASDPTNAELYGYRGKCYVNTNKYDKAIKDFSTMIKIAPNSSGNPYLHRGRCYQKLNDHTKALADFTTGIANEKQGGKKQGRLFSLFMARGRSYEMLGEGDKAIKDYNRCLEFKGGTTDSGTVKMWKEKLADKLKKKSG